MFSFHSVLSLLICYESIYIKVLYWDYQQIRWLEVKGKTVVGLWTALQLVTTTILHTTQCSPLHRHWASQNTLTARLERRSYVPMLTSYSDVSFRRHGRRLRNDGRRLANLSIHVNGKKWAMLYTFVMRWMTWCIIQWWIMNVMMGGSSDVALQHLSFQNYLSL